MAERKRIVGYCDPLTVQPGDTVKFMVSSLDSEPFDGQLVRLICGDISPGGHGFEEVEIDSVLTGRYAGRHQPIRRGSYAVVDPHPYLSSLEGLRLEVKVWPTGGADRRQVVVSTWGNGGGFTLSLDPDRRPVVEVAGADGGSVRLRATVALPLRRWTALRAIYVPEQRRLELDVATRPRSPAERATARSWHGSLETDGIVGSDGPLFFGAERDADGAATGHFNGRLDGCRLGVRHTAAPEVIWDFSADIGSTAITDTGPHGLHGRTVQLPTRAVPGAAWTGEVHDWRADPRQYGAIHFHDDDLVDAGWDTSCALVVPDDLRSGVYALRVRTATSEDHMPFFVLPGRDAAVAAVAYLAPTVTYRAYANIRLTANRDHIFGNWSTGEMSNDRFLLEHPECGLGTYDHHGDGTGVSTSSHLRPVLNLKPKGGLWSFTADTNVTAWLDNTGMDHQVLTDDALHERGLELLAPYEVIVTGTHPEYWTTPMLDALEAYLEQGGRLIYLGANGFYWRTAFHPAVPGTVEVRRAEDGTRYWIAEPGEYHHEATGELGGLWRRLGRPPNLLGGVGFAAQGFSTSGHYRRASGWSDPRVAFAVEGLSGRDILGDHGSVGGGAAGQEIDRYDTRLGSPAHAVVLASSEGLPDDMLRTKEEHFATGFPDIGSEVRADVVYFEGPRGGAVFATGSIAWAGALATDGYDNDVARLTTNVLRRFADPEPVPSPPMRPPEREENRP